MTYPNLGAIIYESLTIDYIICCSFKVFKHLAVHSTNGSSLSQLIYCPVWNIECTISCRTVSSISSFESLLPSGFFVLIVITLEGLSVSPNNHLSFSSTTSSTNCIIQVLPNNLIFFFNFFFDFFFLIHSHEGGIHQPHLPHHLASGVPPPMV